MNFRVFVKSELTLDARTALAAELAPWMGVEAPVLVGRMSARPAWLVDAPERAEADRLGALLEGLHGVRTAAAPAVGPPVPSLAPLLSHLERTRTIERVRTASGSLPAVSPVTPPPRPTFSTPAGGVPRAPEDESLLRGEVTEGLGLPSRAWLRWGSLLVALALGGGLLLYANRYLLVPTDRIPAALEDRLRTRLLDPGGYARLARGDVQDKVHATLRELALKPSAFRLSIYIDEDAAAAVAEAGQGRKRAPQAGVRLRTCLAGDLEDDGERLPVRTCFEGVFRDLPFEATDTDGLLVEPPWIAAEGR